MAESRVAIGTLNLRSPRSPGSIARSSDPILLPAVKRRVLLLIHGYAARPHEALSEYGRFIENLRIQTGLGRLPSDLTILRVLWPGSDNHWFVNKASFSSRVESAEHAGRRLSEVMTHCEAEEVIVVGHSLGCRLVLEFLASSGADQPGPLVSEALLMAAAVPEDDCASGTLFGRDVIQTPNQVVLHSHRDLVLWGAFRPGMRLAQEGWSPAVGRTGGPAERWDVTRDVRLGHSEYWGARVTAEQLATQIGISFNRGVGGRLPMERGIDVLRPGERNLGPRRVN